MADKYHESIKTLLSEKGECGVNEIANAIDVPLSTVQRYLERQTYFKKTEKRKWTLPNAGNSDIKSSTVVLMAEGVENTLKLLREQASQLAESIDNALIPVGVLKKGVNQLYRPPVAKKFNGDINPIFIEWDKKIKSMQEVFDRFRSKTPEQYRELLKNVDLHSLIMQKGAEFLDGEFNAEISALFLEKSDTLSDEVFSLLKEYQK